MGEVEKGLSNAMELANDASSSSVPSDRSSVAPSRKFDRNFIRRFRLILGVLFPSVTSLPMALFGLLLFMCFLEEYVTYNVGLVPSKYYEVLGARPRDLGTFQAVAVTSIAWVICQAILRSTKKFISTVSYVTWRQLLCRSLHSLYFRDNNFYDLNVLSRKIDNPDQRITQDVDKLCDSMGKVFTKVIIAPFIIGYYSYKAFANTGWYGPFGIFVLFVVSSLVNKAIMSPTVQLVFEQEKKEGDFRFKHMQIRSNAESLAFLGTALVESWRVDKKLDELLAVLVKRTNWQYLLDCAVSLFDYSGSIVSYLMLAIPIFAGRYDDLSSSELSGLISQNAFVCIYLAYSFSSLADLAPEIVNIAGNAHRVAELLEVLQRPESGQWDTGPSKKSGGDVYEGGYSAVISPNVLEVVKEEMNPEVSTFPTFQVENLTVRSPLCGTDLIRDLNLQLTLGMNVLITGPSSCGKSSLLRCLRGLWPPLASHGLTGNPPSIRVFLPSSEKYMMFVPQKPFFTDGTMRQQVIYPLTDESAEISGIEEVLNLRVMRCLETVDLKSLVARLGGVAAEANWNWYDVLSPGEMQRLCCARVLFHSPKFILLDEITSAISQNLEEVIYDEFRRVGITFVSVGHRSSLRQFHDVELRLDGHGGWELVPISKISPD